MKLIMVYQFEEDEDCRLIEPFYEGDKSMVEHCTVRNSAQFEDTFEKYTWPLIEMHDTGYREYKILTREEAEKLR